MTEENPTEFLQRLPDRVSEAIAGLTAAELRWRPDPQEWSIIEVCGHLRDAVEIEGLRLRAMLAEDEAFLPAFDGLAYARQRLYNRDDSSRVVAGLRAHCTFVADLVTGLGDADWERTGYHEEAGPVSVASRVTGLIEHGLDHLQQIRGLREQLSRR